MIKYMGYQNIALALLLCGLCTLGSTTTDITLLNCPSQFDLALANSTVNASQSLIDFFFEGYAGSKDEARVQEIVISGNYQDLKAYTKEKMVPYIIIGAIVFFIFILLVAYCLFDKSWPPCERFRRNPIQDPYSKTEKQCMACWVILLAITIFSAGIVSFTAIPNMKTYVEYTKCSIYYTLDISLNGDVDNGWGGFVELKNKIGNISSLLDSASTQVGTYLSNDEWLVNDMTIMKNKNIDIYNQNHDAQLITPNPSTTETNINAGLDYPLIDSVFIQSGLGPNGTFGTLVDDIDRGLRTTQIKSQQAYNIEIAAASMVEASSTIQVNAVAAQSTLAMYIHQMGIVKDETDAFAKQFFDGYFSTGIYVLQGVVGFVLVSSLLVLIGSLSTHFYEIFECRYMVHCGWVIYSLMYFGVLVLGYVTMGLGSIGYSSCQYFNASLNDEAELLRLRDSYSQNVFNRLDVCILGDGDALSKFGISEEMTVVMDLFTNISAYYDYDNPSSANYVDLDISTGKIQGWINAIEKYRLGVYIDSRDEEKTNDNPNEAIKQLNLYSNEGGGVPTCSRDRWVFDSQNCTDSSEITYVATSLEADGVALTTDNVICISFNQKLTTAMNSSWTQSDFTRRYIQIREDCPDAYEKIVYYGYTLINFRDSRTNLYQAIEDSLTDLYTLNSNFNTVMVSFRAKVDQFYESVATLNNIVANQLDGLLVTSNCQTISSSVEVVYNAFCVNFMSEVAKVALCVLIMLVTIVGGMIAGSIFGVRYANIHMLKHIGGDKHEQIPEGSMSDKMNLGDKEIMFSQHSHSSEQEEDEKPSKNKNKK